MKRACPCCHQEFEFSLSSEDKMGNLLECSHCHSTLKWHEQELQVLHKFQQATDVKSSVVEKNILSAELKNKTVKSESDVSTINKSQESSENNNNELLVEKSNQELTSNKSSLDTDGVVVPSDVAVDKNINLASDSSSTSQVDQDMESPIESAENPTTENVNLENVNMPVTKQDLSDVEAYGNMESAAYKGLLRYDLQIIGVDSNKIEEQILSILEDSRLKRDARTCLNSKKNGILQIKNLNPVKAVYLVSQLINLPIELSWKQYMAVNIVEEQDEGKVDLS